MVPAAEIEHWLVAGPFEDRHILVVAPRLLRAEDITTLAMFGIATSGVVLSTVRWAADMDYRLVVVSDACADAITRSTASSRRRCSPRKPRS